MKRLLMAALVSAFCFTAQAQDLNEEAYFKDMQGVQKLLRLNGIDPTMTRWNDIEMVCMTFNKTPQIYNKCRFEHARDQFQYTDDRSLCDDEAVANFPDSLLQPKVETVIDHNTSDSNHLNTASSTTIKQAPLTASDLRAKRRTVFAHCMTDKGWKNPLNYMVGRNQ